MMFVLYDAVTNIVQSISKAAPASIPAGQSLQTVNELVVPNWSKVIQNPTSFLFQSGQFTTLPPHMMTSPYSPITSAGQARGWITPAPALPSGTGVSKAVNNANSYSVRIHQVGSAGTHIVDANGRDVALPSEPTEFTLDPGCKVYYATTVPTSWSWYGA